MDQVHTIGVNINEPLATLPQPSTSSEPPQLSGQVKRMAEDQLPKVLKKRRVDKTGCSKCSCVIASTNLIYSGSVYYYSS